MLNVFVLATVGAAVLETHRKALGRVVYAPRAAAQLQDPTTLRDWYKQNLRWMWGTFQGVIGHRIGRVDYAYVLLMAQWLAYVAGGPVTVWLLATAGGGLLAGLAFLLAGQLVSVTVADLLYRVVMVHALVKAIRQPTVDRCVWTSPTRIDVV